MKKAVQVITAIAGSMFCLTLQAKAELPAFWQLSEGVWHSHNMYMDGKFAVKIPDYESVVTIAVKDDEVITTEDKFYPAGYFNGAAIGLDIPAKSGVHLVQTTRASLDSKGIAEEQAAAGAPVRTITTPLDGSSAFYTVSDKITGDTSYRMLISYPQNNARIVVNMGLQPVEPGNAAGALRGLSVFNGVKLPGSEKQALLKQLETVYNATVTVVREADGQFRVADNL